MIRYLKSERGKLNQRHADIQVCIPTESVMFSSQTVQRPDQFMSADNVQYIDKWYCDGKISLTANKKKRKRKISPDSPLGLYLTLQATILTKHSLVIMCVRVALYLGDRISIRNIRRYAAENTSTDLLVNSNVS